MNVFVMFHHLSVWARSGTRRRMSTLVSGKQPLKLIIVMKTVMIVDVDIDLG
jgi:hypothetical protein